VFRSEAAFSAEIRIIGEFFTAVGTENHGSRLCQTFGKNNLSIAAPGFL